MTWGRAARLTVWNALASITAQLLAVLTLGPADFGTFALATLGYGLASSLSLTLVGEAWTRDGRHDPWARCSTVLVALAAVVTIAGLAVALVLASWTACILAAAIGLATYRLGARFHALSVGDLRHVGRADVAAFVVTLATWAAAAQVADALTAVAVAWLLGSAASVALSRRPRLERGALRRWATLHARSIRALALDAAMLDASVIGVPLLLAPMLGLGDFGTYRALSSAAVPVRLVLSPLRPILATVPLRTSMAPRSLALLVAAGVLVGGGVGGAIAVLGHMPFVQGTVLAALAEHALVVGAFTAASMPLYAAQMIARSRLETRPLLAFRLSSLVLGVALPFAGLATLGLPGVLWGATVAAVADAVVVLLLLSRARRRADVVGSGAA